jgi:PleD family two-component response regulator
LFSFISPSGEALNSQQGIMAAAQDHAVSVTPRKRVLVVDDDDRVRKIHQDQLKSLGVESCFARNGKEAIDIISSDWSAPTFDLILMARHMPHMPLMDGILVGTCIINR